MASSIGMRHDLRVEYTSQNLCGTVGAVKSCIYSYECDGYEYHPCLLLSGKCVVSPTNRTCF